MPTALKSRTLFEDGTMLVDPEMVPSLLLSGVSIEKIRVNSENADVTLFNQLADVEMGVGEITPQIDLSWIIPKQFSGIRLRSWLLLELASKITDPELRAKYMKRLDEEMCEIEKRGLEDLTRVLIYIVSEFRKHDVVWGVGRGSSCASLVLYLIGLHKVDPVKYNIPMSEFFHD